MTGSQRPCVSIVIAVGGSGASAAACLDSLRQQSMQDFEVLLARPATPKILQNAIEQARADIIALTDWRCRFPAGWLRTLLAAHASSYAVIGGAVEHGGPYSLFAWSCHFADYGAFMLPGERRPTFLLAGNHVSYKAALLQKAIAGMPGGYRKVFLHEELARQGIPFLFDPGLVLFCEQRETFPQFLRRYYHDAREFAATRAKCMAPAARLARLLGAPALPIVLLYRRLRAAWEKERRGRLLLSIPYLLAFVIAWSAGELAGNVHALRFRSGGTDCTGRTVSG